MHTYAHMTLYITNSEFEYNIPTFHTLRNLYNNLGMYTTFFFTIEKCVVITQQQMNLPSEIILYGRMAFVFIPQVKDYRIISPPGRIQY